MFPTEFTISEPLFGIMLTSISFLLYWGVSKLTNKSSLFDQNGNNALILKPVLQKLTGFFFLGLIPFIVILITYKRTTNYGIKTENMPNTLYWSAIIVPLIVILSWFVSRNPNNYKNYPQIRIKKWNWKIAFINTFSWLLYLIGYEFLFRGILLFSCLSVFNPTIAIAINTVLYALAHLPKGKMETIGSIPIGILLCYITITTGSIWSAVILHFTMATSNDYISLYFNPKMTFK